MTEIIPHPGTGEALDVKSQPTDLLSHFHDMLAERERDLRTHRRVVDEELVERMDHEGVRTFHAADFTIEVSKPTERDWDIALLQETLGRLVLDGIISASKAGKCVKHEPKVVAMEVRPLESDPRCQRQIKACYRDVPARRTVKVKR
jgi:hypothetical protein